MKSFNEWIFCKYTTVASSKREYICEGWWVDTIYTDTGVSFIVVDKSENKVKEAVFVWIELHNEPFQK